MFKQRRYETIGLISDDGNKRSKSSQVSCKSFYRKKRFQQKISKSYRWNKNNNIVSNFEWCTAKENTRHAIENGMFRTNFHNFTSEEKQEMYDMLKRGENKRCLYEI